MNKQAKRTLTEGIILLTLLAATLVVYLNWTYARAHSNRAQIIMSSYALGTEYAGLITKQYVVAGDTVHQGQPLFKLKSDELTQQIASGHTVSANLIYPLGDDGQMVITASKAGVVNQVDASQGSFVAAGKQIATIADTATLGITADFSLNKSELGRLTPNSPLMVSLPSRVDVNGRITSVVQSTKDGKQVTTIRAALPTGAVDSLMSAGAQVDVTLVLDQSTYYGRLLGYTQSLLSRWF